MDEQPDKPEPSPDAPNPDEIRLFDIGGWTVSWKWWPGILIVAVALAAALRHA